MRVCVVGAGMAGLTAAHRLTQAGHEVDVVERWPGLGGMAATLDVGEGHRLERYYHHLFTSDVHIAELFAELGLPDELEWRTSSVAWFVDGEQHPFVTPKDLLTFKPLPLLDRLRVGATVVALQRFAHDRAPYEAMTAKAWIERWMGRAAWEKLWGPLLRGKFGPRAEDIAMVWLWGKLRGRRQTTGEDVKEERLGYPRGSWEPLLEALVASIEAGGGRVRIDAPVRAIDRGPDGRLQVALGAPDAWRTGTDPAGYPPADEAPEAYDQVLVTSPMELFDALLAPDLAEEVGDGYLGRTRSIEHFAALCLLLELDRPFSPYYWTNVGDDLPFIGLIEHTNFVEPERYGGRRFLYVANYLPHGHPLLALSPDELVAAYEDGLRRVNPDWDPAWVKQRWRFAESAGQPVVTVGYHERRPALRTPAEGLWLATTAQVYPEDRGTNYAVRIGDEVAALMAGDAARHPGPAAATATRSVAEPRPAGAA